jgi:diguanylate cyclase (GGDEF)-like protein/PAS domain S-box-containing protein
MDASTPANSLSEPAKPAEPARTVEPAARRPSGRLPDRRFRIAPFVAAALVLAAATMALVIAVHDLQAGGTAYVAGESRWSKSVHDAIFHLDRFADAGNPSDLEAARAALVVPLSDRRARLAMEQAQPDFETARRELGIGRNEQADLDRLVRMFGVFRDWPEFSRAMQAWSGTDVWILRLRQLADELEALAAAPAMDAGQAESIRTELALIQTTLGDEAQGFSEAVHAGSRRLLDTTLWFVLAAIALLTLLLVVLFSRAMRGLRTSNKRFWNTFEHAPVGMALIDADGRLHEVNDALCRFLGRPEHELVGDPLVRFCDEADRAHLRRSILDRVESGRALTALEGAYRRPDGRPVWGALSLAPLDDGGERSDRYVAVVEDVSERRHLSDELAYQAAHDQLTGLPNRREFERELHRLLRETDVEPARHALGLIDLDQFKIVNDTVGHLAGDALLVRLSERIHHCLRDGDVLARLDGDQFGILLKHCGIATARDVAERLRREIETFGFTWEERAVNVSASIGIVAIEGEKLEPAPLMQGVDLACYEAKDLGRNQIRIHARTRPASIRRQEEMDWVNRIHAALAADRLRLHGQLIAAGDGDRWRCELLVRMEDESGGVHTAAAFMAAAERYHVARTIDRWVVRNGLDWIRQARRRCPDVEAWHINLSGQSVDCESMLPEIRAQVEASGIEPSALCFEITESAAIGSIDEARAFFEALRALGCQVALDDFGKGLSTFDYLKQLPVDLVKIDGGFVRELAHSELDHAMVRSIHEVASVAGKQTIAESVESIELIVRLRQIGIEFLQGHAIHNPAPLDRLAIPCREESALVHAVP